jgi:HD superfamily phosphohydrolase
MRLLPRRVLPSEALIDEVKNEVLAEQHAELEKLRPELTVLRSMRDSQIASLAKLLTQVWLTPSTKKHGKLFFDDPVWGHTCMDEELGELFFHPLVQRLNHIKQLSFAYLRFPNATHSRLAHTLGTCRTIETCLTTMFRNNWLYKATGRESIPLGPTERRDLTLKAKAAALLHDVGHAPFGHTLDKLIGYFDPARPLPSPDKHYSRKYFNEFLRTHLPDSIDGENIAALLAPNQVGLSRWDTLVADLLDSALDADRMDFLVRDAHMTGLLMGVTSTEALIERMCPFQDEDRIFLSFQESCLPYVKDFLVAREEMYALCYEHPPKLAAERIFTRLVENLFNEHKLAPDTFMLLTDEQVLVLLGLSAISSAESKQLLWALLQNVEYEKIVEVDLTKDPNALIKEWNTSRVTPRMGKVAYVDWPRDREKAIAVASGLGEQDTWRVLVAIPDQRTGVPPALNVKILQETGTGYAVRNILDVDLDMQKKLEVANKARQKIRVFVDSRLNPEQVREIEKNAKKMLELH